MFQKTKVDMAIQTEIWATDLAANLFRNNSFLRRSRNDDAFVENKTVHLPQSGSKPGVERNRASRPASIGERTDTVVDYDLHEFTSDPTLITDLDAIEVSYDKRSSVLNDHSLTLNDSIADYVAYVWAPSQAGNIVATTGTTTRPGSAPGATGNRKILIKDDVLKIKAAFDGADIPMDGRFLLLNAQMYADLLSDKDLLNRDFMLTPNLETGSVGRIYGFEVYVRSLVGRYATASTTPKDPTAANATTDNAYALAWQQNFVRAAMGAVKVYADEDKPEYYGSVFSAMVRAGGSKAYSNQRGIMALVEAAG